MVEAITREILQAALSEAVSSGANANGNWLRLGDGTLICWNTHNSSVLGSTNNSGIGTYGWSFYYGGDAKTFPKAFIATPSIVGSCETGIAVIQGPTATGFTFAIYSHVTSSSKCNWIAIGRWK